MPNPRPLLSEKLLSGAVSLEDSDQFFEPPEEKYAFFESQC